MSELPPGPAFIQATDEVLYYDPSVHTPESALRSLHNVPEGYVWQPATDHTGDGWVRPKGKQEKLSGE